MTIKLLADHVLVMPESVEGKTIGGIIIPDTAHKKSCRGQIVGVGQGTKEEQIVVEPGNNIIYRSDAGTEVEVGGEKMLIMRQSDILAVVE